MNSNLRRNRKFLLLKCEASGSRNTRCNTLSTIDFETKMMNSIQERKVFNAEKKYIVK